MTAIKSIPLQALPESAFRVLVGQPLDTEDRLSPNSAYRFVPVFFRAIDIRASAIARMPLQVVNAAGTVVQQTGDVATLLDTVRALLYLTEASIVLTGRAYWLLERNTFGRNETPRWLVPNSVEPQYDPEQGLTSFARRVGSKTIRLALDDMIWWWSPNIEAESGPGPGAGARALAAATALRNQDLYVANYFSKGALKTPIVKYRGNPTDGERNRLRAFFKGLMGLRRAFEPEVFNEDVSFETLGDALNDTVNPALTDQTRADVLMALGVPHSLVLANAANYATAQQDYLSFYTLTIIPEMDSLILPPLNRWLAGRGLRVVGDYAALEVLQAQQLTQAQAVTQLVGRPILTVDEGRRLIGYEPLPAPVADSAAPESTKTEQHPIMGYHIDSGVVSRNEARAQLGLPPEDESQDQRLRRLQSTLAVVGAATGVGIPLQAALRMVGLDVPELEAAKPMENPEVSPSSTAAMRADLARWERKALKRLRESGRADVPFSSTEITPHIMASVSARLAVASTPGDVRAAFKGEGWRLLTEVEQRLYDAITLVLATHSSDVARRILRGQPIEMDALEADLVAALIPVVAQVWTEQIRDLEAAWSIGLPASGTTGSAATDFAQAYTYRRVTGITDTTRTIISKAVASYTSTPGMTRAQLEAQLAPAFGPVRASLIAVSEVTRAASAAQMDYQIRARAAGIELVRVWRTLADELVCSVCGPLNSKSESEWSEVYPDGPGAHAGCRCAVTLKLKEGS